jgi:methionyl-tRNA formyltransferase
MRIVLCGSGDFGVPTLQAILAARHDVAALVTQPARPAGRGGHLRHTPLAQAATAAGLGVLEIEKINRPEGVSAIGELKPQAIVVVAFGQMVRQQVRQLAPLGAFNLHASLLPELRGAAPINWAIIRGCTVTGVTTFSLVDALDAGPMYLQAATDIAPHETAEDVKPRLAALGAKLVCDTLDLLAGGAAPQAQDDAKATPAPMLDKADGIIDWRADAATVRNLIHGTWPWPGGQACFAGKTHRTDVVIARAEALPDAPATGPGRLDATAAAHGPELTVSAGRGRVRIVELQPAGKRRMTWRDFVNGYRVGPGDAFEAPALKTEPGQSAGASL